MGGPTQPERDSRYKEGQKRRGMTRCLVWVPVNAREKLLAYAKQLREVPTKADS